MNIFYLDKCPKRAAQQQCDKHVVKMILESAQMLSTAHHEHGFHAMAYRPTHKNHPSTIWARSSMANYRWLYKHFKALSEEYTRRYGRVHLSWVKCGELLKQPPWGVPDTEFTQPPQCMPDEYKRDCSIAAYRLYYASKADTIDMRWTNASRQFFNQQEIAA